jgi:uncharacterized membrane protein YuzA (DUF378 family)
MQISSAHSVSSFADLMFQGELVMKNLELLAFLLLLVGGINWGLVGVFNYNVVTSMLGDGSTLTRAVYSLVGIGALWEAYKFLKHKSA